MSLLLNGGTKPTNLFTKAHDFTESGETIVCVGNYEISLKDFLALADYVLRNTDLVPDDPRISFVEHVARMKPVPGWSPGRERLEITS